VTGPLLPVGRRARVRVPATSANLGPAFDSAGLALGLYDEVEVVVAGGGCEVGVEGEGADEVPRGEDHLVVRVMRRAFQVAAVPQPGLVLRTVNLIPHGRGLGSSAAATVAGLVAARGLLDPAAAARLDDRTLLALAVEFEGHGDNVGACLLGGLVLVWGSGANLRATRLALDRRVSATVLVPQTQLSTARARGLLPESVPHRVATHAAGHAALLVHALTGRPDLLLAATEDRLHQPYRASAFPESMALVERLRAAGRAAMISGAGPSVLVLAEDGDEPVPAVAGWSVRPLPVDLAGAHVLVG